MIWAAIKARAWAIWAAVGAMALALAYGAGRRGANARNRLKNERARADAAEARIEDIKDAQEIEADVDAMDDDELLGTLLDRVRREQRP